MADLDPRPLRSQVPASPPAASLLQMTRAFLWVCALACIAGALLLATALHQQGQGATYAVAFAALALAAMAATRVPDAWLNTALTALLVVLTLAITATTVSLRWGLASPGLPITGLMVSALCIAAGWRAGALLAGVSALAVAYVAWVSSAPSGASAPTLPNTALQLGTHLIAIAAGMACGLMVSQVMARYVRSAHEREERFRRLLALAADAYWEIDHRYRLVAAADHGGELLPLAPGSGLGITPWMLPQFGCDADTLDELQADLDTRVPFRDLPVSWTPDDGQPRAYLVSGEPRFDERGVFTGYWGVARDVTEVQSAHDALMATETRYQELFSRIPTPLLLHRGGRILDANPAALTLLGHDDLSTLLGSDLLLMFESGDSRERARRRMESLHGQPLGAALPVADFRLVADGRQISVRATSVRVDAEGGPAALAIFVDDTDRLAAEEAVRRSEALLSHLVATSPDMITLIDVATGRYAMVNHSFERLSGYSTAEAVGRTAAELGLWSSTAQRDRFAALLADKSSIVDLPAQLVTRGGRPVSLLLSAARFTMDQREYMVVNARDVTERERQRLEREAILANASIGIAVTRQQHIVMANRHFEQMYGWSSGELLGQSTSLMWADPSDYEALGQLTRKALPQDQPIEVEREALRKDGSRFMALVRGRAIDRTRPFDGTIWIVEDVTEQRQAEQALARARDDAEAANRAKSAFLANTSHELRTPLNGMIGLARLARDEHVSDERRRQYLDQIVQSAQSLAAIISDILDLSKIEAGKLQIEATVFDLGAELQDLQRSYATLAEAHGLELRLHLAADAAGSVRGDPLRVRQIVSNFLTNAIKFTASGHVTLSAQRGADGRVRLEVQDTGPGLDEATSARLFMPFTQADESTTRRFGGTGLGLSICHELVTLMGGSVGVHSRVGEGSTFWAELPLPPTEAPLPPAQAPSPEPGSLAGLRVLMVEDNPVNMMIAVATLQRWGVDVAQAHDGLEALTAVQSAADEGRPFAAVLMDVQMPVMSGHEATRLLREGGHWQPVIALTAAALVTERDAALAAGMNDFLTKPIDPDRLHAALLRWCDVAGPTEADEPAEPAPAP